VTVRVPAGALADFCTALFQAVGVPAPVAREVATSLVYADLRGVESHGVARMEIYLRRVTEGMIDPNAEVRVELDNGCTALIDGGNHFGVRAGMVALEEAMQRARRHGLGGIGVRHSNHFGTAAYFVERAVARGLALIVMSNAPQTMPVTGGVRPFIGTNPLAIGFPTGRDAPYILDMATSVVARGKIIVAAKRKTPIPAGWAIDRQGNPTTDAQAALEGAVLPFGGPKGSGLAVAIDVLCGVLTGAGFGPSVRSMYDDWSKPQNVGHFFLALDIERFMPLAAFVERASQYVGLMKNQPRAPGVDEILYAGEPEHRRAQAGRRDGVALHESLVRDLQALGVRHDVLWPVTSGAL
jgi:LDH2 family malate/lactate/ureidoglycolate dehydrogenase